MRYLTGITTTGTPHLGNYVGAIRPALERGEFDHECFYFLADYHALIKCRDAARVRQSTLEIAAAWMACGLNPATMFFYRQSDIPQIQELAWILSCVTGKGQLNRAHAYKAALQDNASAERDPDYDVTMGLFQYPVLMAADILLFDIHKVPVGQDQIQHVQIARDCAQSFNHLYGNILRLPEAEVPQEALMPGLDGRKMSKSYDNTIPLFCTEKQLRKHIMGIVTNSKAVGEPKDLKDGALYDIFVHFASRQEAIDLADEYSKGIGWGKAKEIVFEVINRELKYKRFEYEKLMANPDQVWHVLNSGKHNVRPQAEEMIYEVKKATGLY
jgi:tryptophanyl-tRNA synthetase